MSRPANPYDNASCESFIKTLNREQIYAHKYRDPTICAPTSSSSSTNITIGNGSTPRSATAPRRSSLTRNGVAALEN